MLLFDNRNFSLIAAILLGIVNAVLFVISLVLPDYLARFAIFCWIAGTSLAAIELLVIVQRTDAITPILREEQDRQLLFSLFEKAPAIAIADKPITVTKPAIQYISELPLDNYLFWGNTAVEMRNRLLAALTAHYPRSQVVNFNQGENARAILNAALQERKINSLACEQAIIVLADSLGSHEYLQLKKFGIYWLIVSTTDIITMPTKFLDTSTVGYYAPGSTLVQALLRDGKVYGIEA
jgi:hypothetical protein